MSGQRNGMAIYHFAARVVKRSGGRSATAAAAYRAGADIADERTGQRFDYTRRRGVVHAEIMAPADAPDWMRDRAQLWNAVEKVEKRKDAQLARDVDLALPHELDQAQRVELVRAFVAAEFVGQGMIADIAIHAPSRRGDQRNAHAHIMLTMRELTGEGFGKKVRGWNDKEQLEGWREAWAEHVNRALERAGVETRVDHRSLEAQGIDREPQTHQGPAVAEMSARGAEADIATVAAEIADRNAERDRLAARLVELAEQIAALEREKDGQAEPPALARNDNAMQDERKGPALTPEPEKPHQPQAADQRDGQAQQTQTAELSARIEAEAPEQAKRESALLAQAERQAEARREFVEDQTAAAAKARAEQEAREREDAKRDRSGDVADAKSRYAQALGEEYRVENPYGSLARAAMNEYGRFAKQQEGLRQQIAEAKTPEERRTLELRKEIEGCEYMVITSQRLATMSRVVTGDRNSAQAQRDEGAAKFYQERATELRAERAALEKQRRDGTAKEPPQQERKDELRRAGEPPRTAADHAATNRTQDAETRQRGQQARAEGRESGDGRSGSQDADRSRKETPAERKQRFRQMMAQARRENAAKDQGRDRGGGRDGGENSR